MIRALIADDEALARGELIRIIRGEKDFEIIAQAQNGVEALKNIRHLKPDVVFLDIEMPQKNGMETASELSRWPDPPLVVFATAYDRYAIEAFEMSAVDYVLKPYHPDRIKKTFERIRDHILRKEPVKENLTALEDNLIQKNILKKVIGFKRNSKDRILLDLSEVLYFYANNTEVLACVPGDELIIHSTLKELADRLEPTDFAQTHKGYLVNLNKVEKVCPLFSGNFSIVIKGVSSQIPLSRRYASAVKSKLASW